MIRFISPSTKSDTQLPSFACADDELCSHVNVHTTHTHLSTTAELGDDDVAMHKTMTNIIKMKRNEGIKCTHRTAYTAQNNSRARLITHSEAHDGEREL